MEIVLSDDNPVALARALAPLLAAHADHADHHGRLCEGTVAMLREAGMFRLATPQIYGGGQAGVLAGVEVCAELARGCASSSWLVGIAYGGALFATHMPDTVRECVWGKDPDVIVCGAANPSGVVTDVSDGVVLNGKWPMVSGIRHSSWVMLGIRHRGARGLAAVPAAEVEIASTWAAAGMRATASDTAVVENLHVPQARLLTFDQIADGSRYRPDEPRVTFPQSINMPLVGTGIGIAQAVLDNVVRAVSGGKRSVSPLHELAADVPMNHAAVADAATLIDSARLHAFRAADELDAAAAQGRRPDVEARARLRNDGSYAMSSARRAVAVLLDVAGSSSFIDTSMLQRSWRDIETASRHAALSLHTSSEIYGRVLLGRELPAAARVIT